MSDNQDFLYLLDTFIRPISKGDVHIFIRDEYGHHRYEIDPCKVTAKYTDGKYVIVKTLGTDQKIKLRFISSEKAIKALKKLNAIIDTLKAKLQSDEDKELEDLVEGLVETEVQSKIDEFGSGATGATGPSGDGIKTYIEKFEDLDTWVTCPEDFEYTTSVQITDDNGYEMEGLIKKQGSPSNNTLEEVVVFFNQKVTGYIYLISAEDTIS